MDFCIDWAENRSRLKVLAIQDAFTKEFLALEAAPSIRSLYVQAVQARLFNRRSGLDPHRVLGEMLGFLKHIRTHTDTVGRQE